MFTVEITMRATNTHASAHHKYIGLDSSTFPHPRRDDPLPRVYYGNHSACNTHALCVCACTGSQHVHWSGFKYLSVDADDPLPRGGAVLKLDAVHPVAQGYLPHADQVVRHPERSPATARRPAGE